MREGRNMKVSPQRMIKRSLALGLMATIALALVLSLTSTQEVQARPNPHGLSWEDAKAKYDEYKDFSAFCVRALAVEFLASSGDPRALEEIRSRYEAMREPKDYKYYFNWAMMYSAYHYLKGEEHARAWKDWAEANQEPMDAWLWYNAFSVWSKSRDTAWLHVVIEGTDRSVEKLDDHLRAAAIHIAALRQDHSLVPKVTKIVEDERLLKKEPNRSIYLISAVQLLEQCGALIPNEDLSKDPRDPKKEPEWQALAQACFNWMDDRKTLEKTKLIMARTFSRTFQVPELYMDGESWRKVMLTEAMNDDDDGRTKAEHKPKFAGIQGTGTRVAFLIDSSDSMLKELGLAEHDSIRNPPKQPTTGSGSEAGDEEEEEDKDEIDWDAVKTRWDAAKAVLAQSLRGLDEDMYFTVVLFGTEAEYLSSTRGLVKATRSNVENAIREIQNVPIGAATDERPDGVLRGFTNLHGALRKGYTAMEGGQYRDEDEFISEDLMEEGVDTMFILSDGDPTICDWPERDRTVEGYLFGDAETRKEEERTDVLDYKGPYNEPKYIEDDLQRLNLFRKIEINCVCIGEADEDLMDKIKTYGNGRFRNIPGGIK